MSKSQRLKLEDVKSIFRLLGEVRELGENPDAWRRHMLLELCRLTHSFVGFGCEVGLRGPSAGHCVGHMDAGGFNDHQRKIYYDYDHAGDHSGDPSFPGAAALVSHSFTWSRERWAEDQAWYRSTFVDEIMRPMESDDFMASGKLLPDRVGMHVIRLQRGWNDPRFLPLQLRRVDLFHQELGVLWEVAARRRKNEAARLPPRQQQVIDALRVGLSEKEVASRLGLSRHTVHRHVSALHKRFNAQSRGELLFKSAPPHPGFIPKLVIETFEAGNEN